MLEKLKAAQMVSFSGRGRKEATYHVVLLGTKTYLAWVYENGGIYFRWGTLKDFTKQYREMWGNHIETQNAGGSLKNDGSFLAGGAFATGNVDVILGILNRIKDVVGTAR